MQNILKEIIFWALLASCDFHNNEVQCPRKALLADAWSEILAGLSELGLTVITSLWDRGNCHVYVVRLQSLKKPQITQLRNKDQVLTSLTCS